MGTSEGTLDSTISTLTSPDKLLSPPPTKSNLIDKFETDKFKPSKAFEKLKLNNSFLIAQNIQKDHSVDSITRDFEKQVRINLKLKNELETFQNDKLQNV